MQVDNLLDVGVRAFSGIHDGSVLASFDDGGNLDVLDFTNAPNALYGPQFVDEVAMRSGIDQRLAQRSAHNGTFGQMVGHRLVLVYQQVGAEDGRSVPRVSENGFGIAFALDEREVLGIFHGDNLSIQSRRSLVLSPTSAEKHDEGCYLGKKYEFFHVSP